MPHEDETWEQPVSVLGRGLTCSDPWALWDSPSLSMEHKSDSRCCWISLVKPHQQTDEILPSNSGDYTSLGVNELLCVKIFGTDFIFHISKMKLRILTGKRYWTFSRVFQVLGEASPSVIWFPPPQEAIKSPQAMTGGRFLFSCTLGPGQLPKLSFPLCWGSKRCFPFNGSHHWVSLLGFLSSKTRFSSAPTLLLSPKVNIRPFPL